MKSINPLHEAYLYIHSSFTTANNKKDEILACINILSDAYDMSSKNKRKNILKYLTDLHLGLFQIDIEDGTQLIMKNFIDKYSEDKDESSIAPFILFKARYEIGCKKNISEGISLAKDAMESPRRNKCINSIVDILLLDKSNIPLVEDFLECLPRDTSEVLILKIKSDLSNYKGDFDTSIKLIDEARDKKWNFGNYILAKAYTALLAKKYNDTIEIIDSNIDKIKSYHERDVLIINREVAKKNLGLEIKKHEVNSILAHHQSKGEVAMCAFFILGDELNGNRQLQSCIEQDYMNYYRFLEWPAVPETALSRYNPARSKVA